MDRQEVLQYVSESPMVYLATVEGGAPRVRAMMLALADEGGLVFCTGSPKAVCRQLQADGQVEMCFHNVDKQTQLRVRGCVEGDDDLEVKKQIVEKFTFLKPVVEQHGWDVLAVWRLPGGEAGLWTEERAFGPTEFTAF